MLVLLPPSETKAPGGEGPPLRLDRLADPELTTTRERVARELVALARTPTRAATVLGLGPRQLHELEHNAALHDTPTMPAIERYTGVLYDALDVGSLTRAERERAGSRLAVGSALFGLVRADDPIPAYRLSGNATLPKTGALTRAWRPTLGPVLERETQRQLVVDLRSGAYRALAPLPTAIDVRVLTERADGSRGVVSHFNKATKGLVARLLVRTRTEPATIDDVARVLRRGGLDVERSGDRRLDVITNGRA